MMETDKELEKYYEDMLSMFRTDGWTTLKEDLFFRKGQLYVIASLLNLEEHVRDAYDRLGEDPDAAL